MLEHGGRLGAAARQHGIPEADWLDLSTGIAPWPLLLPEVPAPAWTRLPQDDDGLEAAARRFYGSASLLPVAGTQAAIQALPQLRGGGRVGVLSPCYAEHASAWRRAGHQVLALDEAQLEASLDHLDVLLLVNPNNPTGRRIAPAVLLGWHARLAARGGWLVVDEAFIDVTPSHSLATYTDRAGLIVLRSFGKFFGLAGVRLGFVLAQPALLGALAEWLGPWAVSGPARALGRVCLEDGNAQARQRQRLVAAGERLAGLLARHGISSQGCALFRWFATPQAADMADFFARRGILLRRFEAPAALRLGLPADEPGWQRLGRALADWQEQPCPR